LVRGSTIAVVPNPESLPEPVPDTCVVEGDKADILARTVAAIDTGDLDRGRQILRREYPFSAVAKNSRRYTERQCLLNL